MRLRWNVFDGDHIESVVHRTVRLANAIKKQVEFTFNDILVIVSPGDSETSVLIRYSRSAWKRESA